MALRDITLQDIIWASSIDLHYLLSLKGLVYIVWPCVDPENIYCGLYKIGHTISLAKRMPQLEEQYGAQVFIDHAIWTDDPPYLEARLHDLFDSRRVRVPTGVEWFDLAEEDIKWLRRLQAVDCRRVREWIGEPEALYAIWYGEGLKNG